MKINGNAIKNGNVIEYEGKLWAVLKTQHVQPGKGGAYLQVEMKELRSGTKTNVRFRSSETVERAELYERDYQFLYIDGEDITLMDQETFDQVTVSKELVGESCAFLQEGMIIKVSSHEDRIVGVRLPDTVVMMIDEADAVIKGQTASSSYKPARLENGLRIMVPPYIESGTRVVVNTADGSYVERAKE